MRPGLQFSSKEVWLLWETNYSNAKSSSHIVNLRRYPTFCNQWTLGSQISDHRHHSPPCERFTTRAHSFAGKTWISLSRSTVSLSRSIAFLSARPPFSLMRDRLSLSLDRLSFYLFLSFSLPSLFFIFLRTHINQALLSLAQPPRYWFTSLN